jgi:NADH-quinone oxidoreductase subunit M
VEKKVKEFSIFILALEAAMIGVFVSLDLFLFYVFWDAMLIPMYFLIGIWGYDQRIYAAVKFMLYTMAGSVLMLVAILGLAWMHSEATGAYSFDLLKLYTLQIAPETQRWFFLAFAWRSRSRCRSSRSTPGCPTRTCRRRPPARSSWPACC